MHAPMSGEAIERGRDRFSILGMVLHSQTVPL